MDIVKGVLASLVAVLICSFWPGTRWLCERCVEAAVRRLPEEHQEAMREEWHADLDAYPGGVWSLFWAVDLVRGAAAVAVELERLEVYEENDDVTAEAHVSVKPSVGDMRKEAVAEEVMRIASHRNLTDHELALFLLAMKGVRRIDRTSKKSA